MEWLLSERDSLMSEIAMRARLGALPPMLTKARTLLTRFWAIADWQSRAEILPTARWLMSLGAAHPVMAPPQATASKRRPRKAPSVA